MLGAQTEGVEEVPENTCPLCGGPVEETPRLFYVEDNIIFFKGVPLEMSRKAHFVLIHLMRRPGRVLSRESLWNFLYAHREDGGPDAPILNIYISQVRKALRAYDLPYEIETIWGIGWILKQRKVTQ